MPPKRACDVCYKRKIQCSILTPGEPCEWCSLHNLDCTFVRTKPNKGKLSEVKGLIRRVQELEIALSRATNEDPAQSPAQHSSPNSTLSPSTSHQRASILSPGSFSEGVGVSIRAGEDDLNATAQYLGQHWYYKGTPILSAKGFSWISLQTGKDVTLQRFGLFGSKPSLTMVPSLNFFADVASLLPNRLLVENALEAYYNSSSRLSYPVIERGLFKETVSTAYDAGNDADLSLSRLTACTCVLISIAMLSRLIKSNGLFDTIDVEECSQKAQALLAYVTSKASTESLQAVLMMQLYRTFTGQWKEASRLHATASRLICTLRGHFCPPMSPYDPPMSQNEQHDRHTRTLFWLCYVLDKDISLRTGHPPLLAEEYCDLTLPNNYTSLYDLLPDSEQHLLESDTHESLTPYFPSDLRLSQVKEKTCRLLYSPQAFKVDDSQVLSRIRQLDHDLEDWRLSIPPTFRPKLTILPNSLQFPPGMTYPQRMRFLHLQLEYLYLMTAIHAIVRRCGATHPDGVGLPDDLHSVVHSSSDLALEAGRSTLLFLKNPPNMLGEVPIWQIASYPPMAAMSLFANILIHPLQPEAQPDLDILATTVSTVQNISSSAMTDEGIDFLQETSEFVSELVRLGNAAIWKARREGRYEDSHRHMIGRHSRIH